MFNMWFSDVYIELLFIFLIDNFIDGAALALLPEDFVEFSQLIPQSGLGMKLKKAIDKMTSDLNLLVQVGHTS